MTRFFRIASALAACLLAIFLLSQVGCHRATDPWKDVPGGNTKVLVSFPPLYCFTKGVVGDDAKVLSLLVAVGPHEHQAGADDAQVAAGADLFLVNGLQLDDFVTTVAKASGNTKIKIVMVADTALDPKERIRMAQMPGHESHGHGIWDPHAWLGIEQAILMVQTIAATMKEADPAHAKDYDKHAAQYVEKLKQLQADGNKMLAGKKNRKIIATHESLAYLCKSFDLELAGSIMPVAGVEAEGSQLAEQEKLCEKDDIHVIAIEPQSKSEKDEALQHAQRQGHKMVIITIDPMETAVPDQRLTATITSARCAQPGKPRQNLEVSHALVTLRNLGHARRQACCVS
jgi:zinc transport system substrate-binding protein